MTAAPPTASTPTEFINGNSLLGGLSTKLILGFTVLFMLVFGGAYYWFLNYSVDVARRGVIQDLAGTLIGLDHETNGATFRALTTDAEARSDGYTDDPRYWNHVRTLANVKEYELGRTGLYSFAPGETPDSVIYIGSAGAILEPPSGVRFREVGFNGRPLRSTSTSPLNLDANLRALGGTCDDLTYSAVSQRMVTSLGRSCISVDLGEEPGLFGYLTTPFGYTDEFGTWISGYVALHDNEGAIVGAIGMDFDATYVNDVRQAILDNTLIAFSITYIVLFLLVYLVANTLTRPLRRLSRVTEAIGAGNYDQSDAIAIATGQMWRDEIGVLADRIIEMAAKIYTRETKLKLEVQQLRIEIDEVRASQQVEEIVETDFFADLTRKAQQIRAQRNKKSNTA